VTDRPDEIAPDGSEVRFLAATATGSGALFRLPAGATAIAVRHRTVDEIWFVAAGRGEIWLADDDGSRVVALQPGACVAITRGTRFQFRAGEQLDVFGVTMPPWPGDGEAAPVDGPWEPTVPPGPGLGGAQRSDR
jgi:mannose-6-phosphate isomerase-like protein (cupin superfamily)